MTPVYSFQVPCGIVKKITFKRNCVSPTSSFINFQIKEGNCCGLNVCVHHNSYVKALTLSVAAFGDGASKKIIKVKKRS
jgi:hypothetical protein